MTDSELPKVPKFGVLRWAIPLSLVIFGLAALAYALNFGRYGVSDNPEQWGQLGDYLGGLVNPIVGLITVILFVTSLRQNQVALAQSREELRQARLAIEQAAATQKATEGALAEQVTIAKHARDMDTAISLWRAHLDVFNEAEARVRNGEASTQEKADVFETIKRDAANKSIALKRILDREFERVVGQYTQ